MFVLKTKPALFVQPNLIVALTTIYWSTFTGLEWHFGFLTTLGAYYREHLPLCPVATISVTL